MEWGDEEYTEPAASTRPMFANIVISNTELVLLVVLVSLVFMLVILIVLLRR